MKFFLVQISNLAVVMHLALGCHWHHGMNSAHACSDKQALASKCCTEETEIDPECGDHDHDGHHEDERQSESNDFVTVESQADSEHEHCHHACMDDGCNVNTVERQCFSPIDFSVAYVGGCDCLNVLNTGHISTFEYPPDLFASAQKMRPHLLLGVQLL